jgi:hypothetical protein
MDTTCQQPNTEIQMLLMLLMLQVRTSTGTFVCK